VARPGAEEYIDNEKYEYKARDFAAAEDQGRSLAPYLRRLNSIRRHHPALQDLQNLTLHEADTPHIVVYSKTRNPQPQGWHAEPGNEQGHEDTIIVVINVDSHHTQEATVTLDLAALHLALPSSLFTGDDG